jgi:hypothetical protein
MGEPYQPCGNCGHARVNHQPRCLAVVDDYAEKDCSCVAWSAALPPADQRETPRQQVGLERADSTGAPVHQLHDPVDVLKEIQDHITDMAAQIETERERAEACERLMELVVCETFDGPYPEYRLTPGARIEEMRALVLAARAPSASKEAV